MKKAGLWSGFFMPAIQALIGDSCLAPDVSAAVAVCSSARMLTA
jgi:hypothetical protein